MSETALISTIVIVQFTILAGLALYLAQRLERRIDRVEARIDRLEERVEARFERVEARFERLNARFERLEERVRAVELRMAMLLGRLFGDDRSEFELPAGESEAPLPGAATTAT